jgi:SAM-dependent MidA family methyltransferase
MLARQIEEMWYLLKTTEFTVVEYGASSGLLCSDILHALKNNQELYKGLQYHIIEKNLNSEIKYENEKVYCHRAISEISEFTGCVLSNEVVDNFPVHLVVMENELMEVFIDYKDDFVEQRRPASALLKEYLGQLQIDLPKGFRTEINLNAINWIAEIASAMKKGFVITIDYGFPSRELYSNKRSVGTLVCYHKHRTNFCPYVHIGEQDITAHVNFSALHHWGLQNGLNLCGFTSQSHFLLSLGLCTYLKEAEKVANTQFENSREKAWLLHTFLMEMGQKLKVLIQDKGLGQVQLSGLRILQQLS